ncbi:MAG: ATP cone domain-containing protein, partial [bacterium]
QVRKKDGTIEPFLRDKIYNGVVKSGGTPDQAEKITAEIEKWAPTVATDGIVNTSDIRMKVLEMLKTENPAAAEQYETFRKEAPVEPVAETPVAPVDAVPSTSEPAPVVPPAVE